MHRMLGEALDFAIELTQEAMAMISAGLRQPHTVLHKAPGDLATELDARIEHQLRARIAERFPAHGFLGEESGGDAALATTTADRPVWVVDPIDGSMNFIRGYPQFSVSIALVVDGVALVGCVGDPTRGEVFSAAAGRGAFLGAQRLQVATTGLLADALAATVFPKPRASFMPAYLAQLGRVLRQTAGLRRSGSMALELAYLAAGRLDLFWEQGMGPWDAAAGVLLVQEAGAQVFTLDGLPWLQSARICAATPALAPSWRDVLTTD